MAAVVTGKPCAGEGSHPAGPLGHGKPEGGRRLHQQVSAGYPGLPLQPYLGQPQVRLGAPWLAISDTFLQSEGPDALEQHISYGTERQL